MRQTESSTPHNSNKDTILVLFLIFRKKIAFNRKFWQKLTSSEYLLPEKCRRDKAFYVQHHKQDKTLTLIALMIKSDFNYLLVIFKEYS